EVQHRLIRDAVRLQENVGLQSITDGEFRRTAWSAGFIWAISGLVPRDSLFDFTDEHGDTVAWQTCYHRPGPTRLPLRPARRGADGNALRRLDARQGPLPRRRPRRADSHLRLRRQPSAGSPPPSDDRRHAPLPRKHAGALDGSGWLRRNRRAALQRPR